MDLAARRIVSPTTPHVAKSIEATDCDRLGAWRAIRLNIVIYPWGSVNPLWSAMPPKPPSAAGARWRPPVVILITADEATGWRQGLRDSGHRPITRRQPHPDA